MGALGGDKNELDCCDARGSRGELAYQGMDVALTRIVSFQPPSGETTAILTVGAALDAVRICDCARWGEGHWLIADFALCRAMAKPTSHFVQVATYTLKHALDMQGWLKAPARNADGHVRHVVMAA
jgi:hypothetical protein